jgi:Rrf2 family protein
MLLSRGSQYTLQALIYLAGQPPGKLIMVREIADQLGIPPYYLGKLLQPISRVGWLISVRGRGGGMRLNHGCERLNLLEVIQLTEGPRADRECLLGFKSCADDSACVLHCQWQPIKTELLDDLKRHTLFSLSELDDALPDWLQGESGP